MVLGAQQGLCISDTAVVLAACAVVRVLQVSVCVLQGDNPKGIMATVQFKGSNKEPYPGYADDVHFVTSVDFFESYQSKVLCVNSFA